MAMKQNNFYLRWQKAAGAAKSESRSQGMRTLVPGLAVVAVSMLGWGVLTLHTTAEKPAGGHPELVQRQYRAIPRCNAGSESAAQFRSLTDYSDGMTELLDSYPDVTSSLLHRVEAAGGSASRSSSPTTTHRRASCSLTRTPPRSSTFRPTSVPCRTAGFFPPSATPATRPMTTAIPSICAVCWQRRSSKGGRYGNCTNDKAR